MLTFVGVYLLSEVFVRRNLNLCGISSFYCDRITKATTGCDEVHENVSKHNIPAKCSLVSR